ncbi:MAG: hypothetical protein KJI71_01835 [Patescibacteria group bacterium]|nr:hypothetical protein [Patescibacteria group bacterium]
MQLTDKQVKKFKEIHDKYGGFEGYTDDQIREIAQGVANLFLNRFKTYQRIENEQKEDDNNND